MTIQVEQGKQYAAAVLKPLFAHLETLDHSERLQWLGGFFGYCAGVALGMVGKETTDVLLQATANLADKTLMNNCS